MPVICQYLCLQCPGRNPAGAGTADSNTVAGVRQMLPPSDNVPVLGTTGGNELNIEQILSLRTDILFIHDGIRVPQQEVLTQAGVRVLAFKANSMDALRERVKLTGEALGPDAAEKAAQYERYFRDNIRRVQERLKNVPASARLRVYHSMGNPLYTSGRPSLNQDWRDLAGAVNVAGNWFPAHSGMRNLFSNRRNGSQLMPCVTGGSIPIRVVCSGGAAKRQRRHCSFSGWLQCCTRTPLRILI